MAEPRKTLESLVPDPENRRKHTIRNVDMIRESINKVGTARSIVIDENDEILAGNATVEAAIEAGVENVRVIDVDGTELVAVRRVGLTDDQKRTLAIYDNRTGELAEWDAEQFIKDIKDGVDFSELFDEAEINGILLGELNTDEVAKVKAQDTGYEEDDDLYTREVNAPIYKVKGERPDESELYDQSRTATLMDDIQGADIAPAAKSFLLAAAARHTVFQYDKVAEYYAHASADVQKLMEDSALVIIDFDRAIELGFVKLSKDIAAAYKDDYNEESEGNRSG